jgi:hypothetical protein
MNRTTISVGAFSLSMLLVSCVAVERSREKLIGQWQVDWECGKESLELKADGSFIQEIDYAGGGHAIHTGKAWKVTPMPSSSVPGQVVLEDGADFCDFGKRLKEPRLGERRLATVWEWGYFILQFNPDTVGFVQIK